MRVRLFIDPGFDYEPHEHRLQLKVLPSSLT